MAYQLQRLPYEIFHIPVCLRRQTSLDLLDNTWHEILWNLKKMKMVATTACVGQYSTSSYHIIANMRTLIWTAMPFTNIFQSGNHFCLTRSVLQRLPDAFGAVGPNLIDYCSITCTLCRIWFWYKPILYLGEILKYFYTKKPYNLTIIISFNTSHPLWCTVPVSPQGGCPLNSSPLDKLAAISQTIFSEAFLWIKVLYFY